MSEPVIFDPELEGLLLELAADPRSRLLRMARPTTVAGLLSRPEPVSSARTGLSAVERHLVEVHRDELAQVLRRACLMRFFSDPTRAIYLNRSKNAHETIQVDTPEQWHARAREALADAQRSPVPLTGIDLLEACLRSDPRESITITQLARASQVLQPTDEAEDYIGLDQVITGNHKWGERSLMQLAQSQPSSFVLSCALEGLGLSAGMYSIDHEAMGHYRAAANACPDRLHPTMSWLYFAARSADRTEIFAASKRLDALGSNEEDAVTAFINAHHAQDESGAERATLVSRQLADSIKDGLGSFSRSILDAL